MADIRIGIWDKTTDRIGSEAQKYLQAMADHAPPSVATIILGAGYGEGHKSHLQKSMNQMDVRGEHADGTSWTRAERAATAAAARAIGADRFGLYNDPWNGYRLHVGKSGDGYDAGVWDDSTHFKSKYADKSDQAFYDAYHASRGGDMTAVAALNGGQNLVADAQPAQPAVTRADYTPASGMDLASDPLGAAKSYGLTPSAVKSPPGTYAGRDEGIRTAYAEDQFHPETTLDVIFNRTQDKRFPSTLHGVVSAPGPAFQAYSGRLYHSLKPTDPTYIALGERLDKLQAGEIKPDINAVFFANDTGVRKASFGGIVRKEPYQGTYGTGHHFYGEVQPREGSVLLAKTPAEAKVQEAAATEPVPAPAVPVGAVSGPALATPAVSPADAARAASEAPAELTPPSSVPMAHATSYAGGAPTPSVPVAGVPTPTPRPPHGDLDPRTQALIDEVQFHGLDPAGIQKLINASSASPVVPVKTPAKTRALVTAIPPQTEREFVRANYRWDTKHSVADRFNKAALEGDVEGMKSAMSKLGMGDASAIEASAKENYSSQDARIAAANVAANKDQLFGWKGPMGMVGPVAGTMFEKGLKEAGIDTGEHGNAMPMTHPEQAGFVPIPTARPTHDAAPAITRDASFTPATVSPLTAAVADHTWHESPVTAVEPSAHPWKNDNGEVPVPHPEAPRVITSAGGRVVTAALPAALAGAAPEDAGSDPGLVPAVPASFDKAITGGLPEPDTAMVEVPPLKEVVDTPPPHVGGDKARSIESHSGASSASPFKSPFSNSLRASLAALDAADMPHTQIGLLSGLAAQGYHMPDYTSGSGGSSMAYKPGTGEHIGVSGGVVHTGTYYDSHGTEHQYEMG